MQAGTATPASRAPIMQAIGEDDPMTDVSRDTNASLPGQAPTERRVRAQSENNGGGRQRPVTWVGNEANVQKLMEDMAK